MSKHISGRGLFLGFLFLLFSISGLDNSRYEFSVDFDHQGSFVEKGHESRWNIRFVGGSESASHNSDLDDFFNPRNTSGVSSDKYFYTTLGSSRERDFEFEERVSAKKKYFSPIEKIKQFHKGEKEYSKIEVQSLRKEAAKEQEYRVEVNCDHLKNFEILSLEAKARKIEFLEQEKVRFWCKADAALCRLNSKKRELKGAWFRVGSKLKAVLNAEKIYIHLLAHQNVIERQLKTARSIFAWENEVAQAEREEREEKELRARKRQEVLRRQEEAQKGLERRRAQLAEEQFITAVATKEILGEQIENIEALELYISDAAYQLEACDPYKSRLEGRAQAIEQALKDGFSISSMSYELSEETKLLLKEYEIDPIFFEICVGNVIQQEIRKELADLFDYEKFAYDTVPKIFKDALVKSASIVDEFSSKGFFAGAYKVLDCSLQMINLVVGCGAEMAEEIFLAPFKVANHIFDILAHPQETCVQMWNKTRRCVEFCTDVSIVLLNELLARDECLFHPTIINEIKEKVGNDIEYIRRKVERAGLLFLKMPFQEKAKLITSIVAEFLITAKLLKFLHKVKGKALPKIKELFEAIRKRDRIVVTANGIEIAVAQGGEAVEAAMTDIIHFMDSECAFEKAMQSVTNQWEEAIMLEERIAINAEAIRSMEQRGVKIADNFRRAALQGKKMLRGGRAIEDGIRYIGIADEEAAWLKDLFIDKMGGEKTLKELGLEGAVIDEKFIKHFTSGEIKQMVTRSGKVSRKLSGCHVVDEKLLKSGIIRLENVTGDLIKEVNIRFGDYLSPIKTIFPIGWSKEQVVVEIAESLKRMAQNTKKVIGNEFLCAVSDLFEVKVVVDVQKRFVTVYPFIR